MEIADIGGDYLVDTLAYHLARDASHSRATRMRARWLTAKFIQPHHGCKRPELKLVSLCLRGYTVGFSVPGSDCDLVYKGHHKVGLRSPARYRITQRSLRLCGLLYGQRKKKAWCPTQQRARDGKAAPGSRRRIRNPQLPRICFFI